MAATVLGTTGFIHGITASGTLATNCELQNLALGKSDALVNEVMNAAGQLISVRTDDQRDALTGDLRVKTTFTALVIGAVLTIPSTYTHEGEYRILTTNDARVNNDHSTFSFTAVKEEYIDLTP